MNATSQNWIITTLHSLPSPINKCKKWAEIKYSADEKQPDETSSVMESLGLPSAFGSSVVAAVGAETRKRRRIKEDEENNNFHNESMPGFMDESMEKYWHQRYDLFSKFDLGVQLDREGWFSVTPESIARDIAEACRCDVIIDAFCGVGGNAIQFAMTCERVIAIDNCLERLLMAKRNAEIYDVADRIEFILGDFLSLSQAGCLKGAADIVFLSPPWGGPEYCKNETYDLSCMMEPLGGSGILEAAMRITPNVAFFIPRNTDLAQIKALDIPCRVQANRIVYGGGLAGAGGLERCNDGKRRHKGKSKSPGKVKALTVYFGSYLLDENPYWGVEAGKDEQ